MRPLVIFALAVFAAGLTGCPSFTAGDEPSFRPEEGQIEVRRPGEGEHPEVAQKAPPTPPPPRPQPVAPPDQPVPPRESIAARHVLVMYQGSMRAPPNVTRTKEEARTRAEDVLRRARRPGADFAALAREFSDEPGANERGGDLGNFTRGTMVPPFEQAAFALEVNGVSDLVETPFGFHVIQRYR